MDKETSGKLTTAVALENAIRWADSREKVDTLLEKAAQYFKDEIITGEQYQALKKQAGCWIVKTYAPPVILEKNEDGSLRKVQ